MPYSPSEIARVFERQASACTQLGSPLYASAIAGTAGDILAEGPMWRFLRTWEDDLEDGALPLRVFGGLHYLALSGGAPELAALYPSCGGVPVADQYWPAIRSVLERIPERLRPFLDRPPQTNEVGRSAILVGGFLEVARLTGLPLRPREVGASAGLNQCWDLYGYDCESWRWAQDGSALVLRPEWKGGPPPFDQRLTVTSRGGCDLNPLDIRDPDIRLRLQAYVWPDQAQRLANMRAALEIALAAGIRVERASASEWTRRELAERPTGQATVIYHSIVRQYFPQPEREAFDRAIAEAGESATADRPVAWLRFEQTAFQQPFELRLTLWPTGEDRLLAYAHPHGAVVKWLA